MTSSTSEWPFETELSPEKIDYQSRIFARHPLFRLLNFSEAEYAYGFCRFGLPWQEQLSNYGQEMHGGMASTMIDTATGQAIFTALKRGWRLTTVHLDTRFFRPFREGVLIAEGRVNKWGRSLCHAEATLTCGDEVIAQGAAIYAIIPASRRVPKQDAAGA
ncbi:MAG: PaaI family thioesterase [Candidatus Dadabacteria bacterium]|nr:MAG: PaaI family thioesterase [Candidatus Dadabacteria bacterium]